MAMAYKLPASAAFTWSARWMSQGLEVAARLPDGRGWGFVDPYPDGRTEPSPQELEVETVLHDILMERLVLAAVFDAADRVAVHLPDAPRQTVADAVLAERVRLGTPHVHQLPPVPSADSASVA